MDTARKTLILIVLILILIVPVSHKLLDQMPPDWFIGKFKDSWIAFFPGITASYYLIVLLELVAPLFILIGGVQFLLKSKVNKYLRIGFLLYSSLFIVLTFGSFLVQDYSNGFKDFMYFVAIILIEKFFFSEEF